MADTSLSSASAPEPTAATAVSSTPAAAAPVAAAPAAPSKALSWASLAKQNLPPQQPTPALTKSVSASSKSVPSKRPNGSTGAHSGKSASSSTTKLSKAAGASQRASNGGSGSSSKDADDHPFTTVTTSRSASSRSVDWRRKDDSAPPKPRRVDKEKGDKPPHRHGEKKAGPSSQGNGKSGGPSSAKGAKKADSGASAAPVASTTASLKPVAEESTAAPTEASKEDELKQESHSDSEPITPVEAAPEAKSVEEPLQDEPEPAAADEPRTEPTAELAPTPEPAPAPKPAPKPPAVNIWKVRASTATPAAPVKPPKGFPTAAAAAALAKTPKAEMTPTPSSPPTSTNSLFTPSNSSAPTVSPPSTVPATSTTPSLADEAWPEPSMAAAATSATPKSGTTASAEGEESASQAEKGQASEGASAAAAKSKKEKKKWVQISPAELQASVDQANAASGKTKKPKRATDEATFASGRPSTKKKGEGSAPSASSASASGAPSKKAKKAATAAAQASAQANGIPLGPDGHPVYPPPSLIQHHSPHLDHFQPPPSAYNPHLADMPILPISHLTSAEELVMPQDFDLTAGLPSVGPLSSRDASHEADQVEISKDVEMSLLKKSGGRSSLGGRVEGNGMPVDVAGALLSEAHSLQSQPMSSSSPMDRSRSAPLSGAIPIRAPPSNGLNVQSSVFRPAGAKSARGGPSPARGGSNTASSSGRGGSAAGRSPGPTYASRPNPFAGPYQQATGQLSGAPSSHDGRSAYLSPPPASAALAGGLPPSPHSSHGSYPKESHMPRLSPGQLHGSFGSFPPPPAPFGQSPPLHASGPGLGLSPGPNGPVANGNVPPYGSYHAGPPMPMPVTVPAVPLEPLRFYLLGQLEYYFGAHNLVKDFFLRKSMDSLGFVDIPVIAAFNRVKTLTLDLALVREVLLLSNLVEVREQKVRLVNKGWQQWLLPDAPASEVKEVTATDEEIQGPASSAADEAAVASETTAPVAEETQAEAVESVQA